LWLCRYDCRVTKTISTDCAFARKQLLAQSMRCSRSMTYAVDLGRAQACNLQLPRPMPIHWARRPSFAADWKGLMHQEKLLAWSQDGLHHSWVSSQS
jgi:hypothetical protein